MKTTLKRIIGTELSFALFATLATPINMFFHHDPFGETWVGIFVGSQLLLLALFLVGYAIYWAFDGD